MPVELAERYDLDRPERGDRLAVGEFEHRRALGGQRFKTTAATVRPAARAASIVSSVWLIVPRPGARDDHDRQAERAGEVADREGRR